MTGRKTASKRGQVATENLILYAIVITAVVVGLIVVWQTGVFKPQPGKRGWVGFSQITPTDWEVAESRVFLALRVESDSNLAIDAQGINVTFPRRACALAPGAVRGVVPGQRFTVEIQCPGIGGDYAIGEEYEFDVIINYTNNASGRRHTSVGKIYGVMEAVPDDWTLPPDTTTTTTTIKQCRYHECNVSGGFDEPNCGDIEFPSGQYVCRYCEKEPDPIDGKRKCQYDGSCGESCTINRDCDIPDPLLDSLNWCKFCKNNTCDEDDNNDTERQCGDNCPPFDFGTLNSSWCNITGCNYCYHEWSQPLLTDLFLCEPPDDCGKPCVAYDFDIYNECRLRCSYCMKENDTYATCDQGDCGKKCSPSSPTPDCELGCRYCNATSLKCELGDCGKPCVNSETDCILGCDMCFNGVCVKSDLIVKIDATNGTRSPKGKEVAVNQTIFLDVTGKSTVPIEVGLLLVSNGSRLPDEFADCNSWASARNVLGRTSDPYTDDWFVNISWMGTSNCGAPAIPPNPPITTCSHTWTTSESSMGTYCYFALAQAYSPSGNGRWSPLAVDYMRVGFMEVYLIAPRDGAAPPH
jgi:hypothetical protein